MKATWHNLHDGFQCQCFWLLLFVLVSTAIQVQAVHFVYMWLKQEQPQQEQIDANSEPMVFVAHEATPTEDVHSSTPLTFAPSSETTMNLPTPDATGALLISLLWEKGRSMIHNHLKMQRKNYQKLLSILLYKPPVGMVSIFLILELIITGRVFRLYDKIPEGQEEDEADGKKRQRPTPRFNRGRAFSLDARDQSYISYGVIESVRGRLCVAALADLVQEQEAANPFFAADRSARFFHNRQRPSHSTTHHHFAWPWILATALDALSISCPPGGSRYDYVNQLREPLALLRASQVVVPQSTLSNGRGWRPDVLQVATRVLELRATDALLRECRDRLLKTSHRLARTVKYWNRRVEQAKAMAVFQQSLIRNTIEGDRLRLSYVEASLEDELDRLGCICQVLLLEKKWPKQSSTSPGRPKEMNDVVLLEALRRSDCESCGGLNIKKEALPQNKLENWNNKLHKKKWRSTWRLPKISRYAVRMERGWLKVVHLAKDTFISGPSAMQVIMEDDYLTEWYADAEAWIRCAKSTICAVLERTLEASVSEGKYRTVSPSDDIDWIRQAWELGDASPAQSNNGTQIEELALTAYNCTKHAWKMSLHLVDEVSVCRRVGEGRTLAFRDLSIVGWLSGFDFFGIPSGLIKVYLAYRLHAWLAPRWPTILAFMREAWRTAVTIFMARFWEPGKDVILDILNRGKSSMLDGFNLQMEEDSLDMMLKEMKFGDGTPGTRGKALEAATRQYEQDFRSGLFANLASGQLVRLLLIQMQQVKVGMLQAVSDIDVLMQANKLNMRVLAVVPAVFLVMVATRTFARHLYNIRSRDMRPIHRVHEDMTEHLHRMQSMLLLANEALQEKNNGLLGGAGQLGSTGLGDFVVRMHCFLILLDYCTPRPFPKKQCDSLHQSLREVLGSINMQPTEQVDISSMATPVALLDLVMRKTRSLKKYL